MWHSEMINNFKEINSESLHGLHSHCLRGTALEIKPLTGLSCTYFLLCSCLGFFNCCCCFLLVSRVNQVTIYFPLSSSNKICLLGAVRF